MPYVEAVDAQDAVLHLALFVEFDDLPLLKVRARHQSVQEVLLGLVRLSTRLVLLVEVAEVRLVRVDALQPLLLLLGLGDGPTLLLLLE